MGIKLPILKRFINADEKNMVVIIKRYKIFSCHFVKGRMVKLFDFPPDHNKQNKYDIFCIQKYDFVILFFHFLKSKYKYKLFRTGWGC